jgi:hypothetical protein
MLYTNDESIRVEASISLDTAVDLVFPYYNQWVCENGRMMVRRPVDLD